MTLYMIGLGLYDEKDITVKGLEAVKKCSVIYLENYTSILSVPVEKLEEFYSKKIILADREMIEKRSDDILNHEGDIAFLVVGDVFGATTHTDLMLRAKEKGMKVEIIHNTSIMSAIGVTGLELYKFGRTTSIPFEDQGFRPKTPYIVIKQNQTNGLHTLCLLDIKVKEPSMDNIRLGKNEYLPPRYMTINQSVKYLLDLENEIGEKVISEDTIMVGCARLGAPDQMIVCAKAKDLMNIEFGSPLHSLIIPGNLHFIEEEALKLYEN